MFCKCDKGRDWRAKYDMHAIFKRTLSENRSKLPSELITEGHKIEDCMNKSPFQQIIVFAFGDQQSF